MNSHRCLTRLRWGLVALSSALLGVLLLQARHNEGGGPHSDETNPVYCPDCVQVVGLPEFVDPLPIPRVALPDRTNATFALPWNPTIVYTNLPVYDMPMYEFPHYFHRDLPTIDVFGYQAEYPGPTVRATVNVPLLFNWINNLPPTYPLWLQANTNFHGVTNQSVRTVVHLHGAATLPRYDGYPTNNFFSGTNDVYLYNNLDLNGDGETLWYHDHAIGVTAINVYSGLEGFYLLTNPEFEAPLNLPKGEYEVPLVFQDRDIQATPVTTNAVTGEVTYGEPANLLYTGRGYHSLAVVNGAVTPYFQVEPRKYRFRVLNGANFRTFGLALLDQNSKTLPIYVIGNDDGFLQQTVVLTRPLNMMPAERADIILDFSKYAGTSLTMISGLTANNNSAGSPILTNLMQFRVTLALKGTDTSSIPGVIVPTNEWVTAACMTNQATVNREITLDLTNETPFPGPPFTGPSGSDSPFALINMMFFDSPITEQPRAGSTEIWSFINLTDAAHPLHVHLLDFRVVDRQRFAGWDQSISDPPIGVTNYINDRLTNGLKPLSYYLSTNTSDYRLADPFESGPKDVVRAAPFSVTRIVMTWPTNELFYTSPSAANLDPLTAGRYVYHCHLLEHEDDDMMRPLQVLPPDLSPPLSLGYTIDSAVNPSGNNHLTLHLPTEAEKTYVLQAEADLALQCFTNFSSVLGTGSTVSIVPPSSTDPMLLYRASPYTVHRPPPGDMAHH